MKVSQCIENLKPYVPGKSIDEIKKQFGLTDVIKLASNENPLGPSKSVIKAIVEAANAVNRYPDGSYAQLKNTIANHFALNTANITVGNGSNELIDLLIRIYCEPGQSILASKGSFIAYKICAQAARVNVTETELVDYKIQVDALIKAWTPKHRIIFIPNPNNPTGCYLNCDEVQKLLDVFGNRDDVLLVIDEAYNEFVRAKDYPNSMALFKDYNNLIVLRTFAKVYGLAGLRVGAMIAPKNIVEMVDRVRNPFNVNLLATHAVVAALADKQYIEDSKKMVWDGLDYFYNELNKMGLEYCPSQGNFVFFDTKQDSTVVFEKCLQRGVILRPVKGYGFFSQLRMSVGLSHENKRAIEVLKEIL